jgi:hypothetical protein
MDRRVKLAPKAQPKFETGGVSKFGYDAAQTRANLKKRQFRSTPGFQLPKTKMVGNKKLTLKSSGTHKAITGRYFADQAAWMAAGAVENALLEKRSLDEGMDEYWNIADQIKSVVGMGATFINPLLGAVAGPVIEGLLQWGDAFAKNTPGGMLVPGLDQKEGTYTKNYREYLDNAAKNNQPAASYKDWKEWKQKTEEYEKASDEKAKEEEGGSCQIITETMLDGMTIEEFMEQEGIEMEKEKVPPPPPEPPKTMSPEEVKKREDDLKWGDSIINRGFF